MSRPWIALSLLVPLAATAGAARAERLVPIEGEVIESRSRWTAGGTSIVTDSTIRTREGEQVEVSQLGGAVGQIGMIVSHHPRPLRVGEYVRGNAASIDRPEGERALILRSTEPVGVAASSHEGELAVYGVLRAQGAEPIHWNTGCVQVWLDAEGTAAIEGTEELDIVREAFETWSFEVSSACDQLNFATPEVEGITAEQELQGLASFVTFRDESWCRPSTAAEPENCYDPDALAVTSTFFIKDPTSPRFGEIVTAQIEINTALKSFSLAGEESFDLKSTITHEIGHLLGLDHNCWTGEAERPRDLADRPVPLCENIPDDFQTREATMFYSQSPGETKMSTLHADDVLGGCALLNDLDCKWEVRSEFPLTQGCSLGRARVGGWTPLALLVLLLGIECRRRRSPRERRVTVAR